MTQSQPPRVAIIGGGIAGLSAAYELRKLLGEHASILILEAYDRLGGKLKTVDFDTGPVDMGAEAYLGQRQDFTDLVEELGLGDDIRTPSGLPSGFFVADAPDGPLVDIPKNTVMGIPVDGDSVRHILGDQASQRIDAERDGSALEWEVGADIAVGELVGNRLGRSVVEQLVSPLLGGVYSSTADDLGVRATVPQLAEALDDFARKEQPFYLLDVVSHLVSQREAQSAGQQRGPAFRSVVGGYAAIVDALVEKSNPEVQYNSAVESIFRIDGGWYIEPIGEFDALIIATPAPTASVLLNDVAPNAAALLDSVQLASSVVVGMRFESDEWLPQRSGVLMGDNAPTEAKAFTFSSRKWGHIGQSGGAIVRASFGTLHKPWYLEVDDRALLSYAMDDLETVTGSRQEPVEYFVQRWWGGLPCYGVGHLDRMQKAFAEVRDIPGLAIAGSMLNGVGVPATAATGIAAAREIFDETSK